MTTDPAATAVRDARALQETVAAGASAAPRPDEVPIVNVTGYKLLDTIGTGACGVVYKARHEKLDREVALKTVLAPTGAPGAGCSRFEHEARALAQLQHPNIVAVFDTGPCERPAGYSFLAMELLDGETLDAVAARGPLPEWHAWLIARQAVAALAEADRHQIVHRDIKPANLYLVEPPAGVPFPEGARFVKVTDFGLALERGVGIGSDAPASAFVGTPVYMAPEQMNPERFPDPVDRRADIYALGATVFHARTGKVPFDGRSSSEIARQKELEPPTLPNGSPEETALLKRMMARDPKARPQTYDELLKALDALPCLEPILPAGTSSGRHAVCAVPAVVAVPVPVPVECPPEPPCLRTKVLQVIGVLAIGLAAGAGLAALFGAFGAK